MAPRRAIAGSRAGVNPSPSRAASVYDVAMARWLPRRGAALGVAVTISIAGTLSAFAASGASAAQTSGSASVGTLVVPSASLVTGLLPSLPIRAGSLSLRAQRGPNGTLRVEARSSFTVTRHFQAELAVSPCDALQSPSSPGVVTLFFKGSGVERYADFKPHRRYTLTVSGTITSRMPGNASSPTWTDCAEADLVNFREDGSVNQAVPSLVGAFLFNPSNTMGAGGALVVLTQTTPSGQHV